jgi:hypothetical protein
VGFRDFPAAALRARPAEPQAVIRLRPSAIRRATVS